MSAANKQKCKNPTTFIDLFAGIGGTRIAFERAGCTCVFSSEWDRYAQDTYEIFFGERPYGDIKLKSIKKKIPSFNILVAGFPCQPFSSIGKRQGFGHPTQGTLFHHIVNILDQHRPEAFLLENVSGLKNHDGGKTYQIIKSSLDQISKKTGYWVSDNVLNAADFGVPQKRKRIYLVGFRKDLVSAENIEDAMAKLGFSFSKIKPCKPCYINEHLEYNITDRPITSTLQKNYIHKKNDGRPQILKYNDRQIANTLVASYYKIQRLTGIFVEDKKTGLRLLSENECRAIMGFPKICKKYPEVPVSRTQMFKQFGNSVAVPVITKIAKQIKDVLFRLHI
jgi:DNA (cytosine-5)-methyltransferase 1